jgi:glycosyltransferase involved in cell wall biosynthesis
VKVLYSAIDQTVPGTKGGSVHVAAVAEGLAALGHEVTALITPGNGAPRPSTVRWVPMPPPFGSTHLRLARAGAIAQLARGIKPDAIIERYHNFGGEAIRSAAAMNAVSVLEVNAPVIDHAGSSKALVDRALLVEPMRRWREHLCALADVIVTPNAAILPPATPAAKIRVLEWGADTDRFRPDAAGKTPYAQPGVTTVAVFAGAFRSWHGAVHLVEAIKVLRGRGVKTIGAVLIGDGAELARVRQAAAGVETILFTGALAHDRMPAALAGADIGVAPFDIGAHAPLSLGFYWSPLKIFEYMASGLPVVAPAVDRIPSLVADGREGVLYDLPPDHLRQGYGGQEGGNYREPEGDRPTQSKSGIHAELLADALVKLTDVSLRKTLGAAARERALRDYSWAAHCRALETAITDAQARRG